MRRLLAIVSLAVLLAAPASAKTLAKLVAVGADGASVEVHGVGWAQLRMEAEAVPAGGYVLLYPLMERGVPAQPGRFYPASGAACFSWNRSVVGTCWRVADDIAQPLASLPLLTGQPTILASLFASGRSGSLQSNGAVAIELAFGRPRLARAAKK